MEILLKHALEDYLVGGVMVCRETYEDRTQEIEDSWTDYIEPNYVFWEGGSDPRHLDLSLIGVLHDESINDLYKKFAKEEYGLSIDDLNRIFDIDPDDSQTEGTMQGRNEKIQNKVKRSEKTEIPPSLSTNGGASPTKKKSSGFWDGLV
jgi:hypothetical protein